jgi:magnesium chelatase family protein
LLASEQVQADVTSALFLGELSLDGKLRHTHGILPMVALAKEQNIFSVYVPDFDAKEAALVAGIDILPINNLAQLAAHMQGVVPLAPYRSELPAETTTVIWDGVDFAHVKGQEHVKRALEVAAAGGHNVIMTGPPGAGKTLLARALPSILPRLTLEESLEVTKIYSVSGLLPLQTPLINQRPFRSPHHTISHAGLVGGGRQPRPGEISLSHRGVLFLDELPEFGPATLEVLRQPMEDRVVTISRAQGSVTFPANFMLLAAMNPCPCGYYGDSAKECTCSPSAVQRYQRRISGPLLDRVDIFIDVPRVEYEKLSDLASAESSEVVRERVEAARECQQQRFKSSKIIANAEMTPVEVRDYCQMQLDEGARSLLRLAMNQLSLSARAFHRVLKVARTIADLAASEVIASHHLAEALQYRHRSQI